MKSIFFSFLFFIACLQTNAQYIYDWSIPMTSNQNGADCSMIKLDENGKYFYSTFSKYGMNGSFDLYTCVADINNGVISSAKALLHNTDQNTGPIATGVFSDSLFNYYISINKYGNIYILNQQVYILNNALVKYDSALTGFTLYNINAPVVGIKNSGEFFTALNNKLFHYTAAGVADDSVFYPGKLLNMHSNGMYMVKDADSIKTYSYPAVLINLYTVPPLLGTNIVLDKTRNYFVSTVVTGTNALFTVVSNTGAVVQTQTMPATTNMHALVDSLGNLIVQEMTRIQKFTPQGVIVANRFVFDNPTGSFSVPYNGIKSAIIDKDGNILYGGSYTYSYNQYRGFGELIAFVPPSLALIRNETSYNSYGTQSFMAKIKEGNFQAANVNLNIKNFYLSNICTENYFQVTFDPGDLPPYPVPCKFDIEISDSTGSFANPVKIGTGIVPAMYCTIPETVPGGSGYHVRANMVLPYSVTGNSSSMSFAVKRSPPLPYITVDSSIQVNASTFYVCNGYKPMVAHSSISPSTYAWSYLDDQTHREYTIPGNTNTISGYSYAVSVVVVDTVNGCPRRSNRVYESNFYQGAFDIHSIVNNIYDDSDTITVCNNSSPILIFFGNYNYALDTGYATVSGEALHAQNLSPYTSGYTFYPDSVQPGYHTVGYKFDNNTSSCFTAGDSIVVYVDSCILRIQTGIVANGNSFCSGDTVNVPFKTYAPFNPGNIFKVLYKNQEIGSGTQSPIQAVMPHFGNNAKDYYANVRVISTNPADTGTYNYDGYFTLADYAKPVISSGGILARCFPVGSPLSATSGNYGQYQWYFNNSLVLDTQSVLKSDLISQNGSYHVTYTETGSFGCQTFSDTISVMDSSQLSVAVLHALPDTNTFCYNDSIRLSVQVLPGATVQWFINGILTNSPLDTVLYATTTANYYCLITNPGGCTQQSASKYYYAQPSDNFAGYPDTIKNCAGTTYTMYASGSTGYTYQWYKNGSLIPGATQSNYSINANGAYKVFVTTPLGCTRFFKEIYVVFNSPSVILNTSTSISVCANDSALLQVPFNAAATYAWRQVGSTTVIGTTNSLYVTTPAGYYVTATSNGCSATSQYVYVQQAIPPAINITPGGPVSFCQGGSVTLSGAPASGLTYQWYVAGNSIAGATANSYTTGIQGYYKLYAQDTGSTACHNFSNTIYVSVPCRPVPGDINSNIRLSSTSTGFVIYPNPVTRVLYVNVIPANTPQHLKITDLTGRILSVIEVAPDKETITVNVNNFAKGIYLIEMNGEVKKFIRD